MRLKSLFKIWNDFFYSPVLPHSMALMRISMGLVCAVIVLFKWPYFDLWVGTEGVTSLETLRSIKPPWEFFKIQLITGPIRSEIYLSIFLLSSISLMVGYYSRVSAFVVYLCYNLLVSHHTWGGLSGANVGTAILLGLIFSDSGAAWSLDAVRRNLKSDFKISRWGHRFLQVYLSLIYIACAVGKSTAPQWRDGSIIHAMVNCAYWAGPDIQPLVAQFAALNIFFSWSIMTAELSFGTLIWIKKIRYPVAALAIVFHLGMQVFLDIPAFQLFMITLVFLFIDPKDLIKIRENLHSRFLSTTHP